ncbi:hypothetical protein D3C78_1175770 [compost metagenome]
MDKKLVGAAVLALSMYGGVAQADSIVDTRGMSQEQRSAMEAALAAGADAQADGFTDEERAWMEAVESGEVEEGNGGSDGGAADEDETAESEIPESDPMSVEFIVNAPYGLTLRKVVIRAKTDLLTIDAVTLNRGNCEVRAYPDSHLAPKLPTRVGYGNAAIFSVGKCDKVIEVVVDTPSGTYSYDIVDAAQRVR